MGWQVSTSSRLEEAVTVIVQNCHSSLQTEVNQCVCKETTKSLLGCSFTCIEGNMEKIKKAMLHFAMK